MNWEFDGESIRDVFVFRRVCRLVRCVDLGEGLDGLRGREFLRYFFILVVFIFNIDFRVSFRFVFSLF